MPNAMRIKFLVLAVTLVSFPYPSSAQCCPIEGEKHGYWSKLAVVVCQDLATSQLHFEMPSPDGKKTLFVQGRDMSGTVFVKSGGQNNPQEVFSARAGDEVLWSPDSTEIATTYCFGSMGPCKTSTTLDDDRFSPTEVVSSAFAAGHENDLCYAGANIGALAWDKSSDRIVLVAEIPPSPQCADHHDGYFEAFVVSFSERKVIGRFDMQETVRRWHSILGWGLRSDIKLVREDSEATRKKNFCLNLQRQPQRARSAASTARPMP